MPVGRVAVRSVFVWALLCGLVLPATAEDVDRSWWTHTRESIADAEYHVTWHEDDSGTGAWQAPNRRNAFRAFFEATGARLVPRQANAPAWGVVIAWAGLGRGIPRSLSTASRPHVEADRLERDRPGSREGYRNAPTGLEHEIELGAPPGPGSPGANPVVIDFELGGSLNLSLAGDGTTAGLIDARGHRVLLQRFSAADALGRSVPVSLAARNIDGRRVLRLLVDDRDAIYPVVLKSVLTTPAWSIDGAADDDGLGSAVAGAGDVNGDGFADLLIGVPGYDGGNAEEGRALLFLGSASGPPTVADWFVDGGRAGAELGYAMATAGDVNGDGLSDILLGAPGYTEGALAEGAAFVFLGAQELPAVVADWSVEGGQADSRLGSAVATAGDVNGDGLSDVVVGQPFWDGIAPDGGRALLFAGTGSGPAAAQAWFVEGDTPGANLGSAVASAGDTDGDGFADVIVGSPGFAGAAAGAGRAALYRGSATGLVEAANWTTDGELPGAALGSAVGTAGDVNGDGYADAIVAAPGHGDDPAGTGRVYVFLGSMTGPAAESSWTTDGDQEGARLGTAAATVGDWNGDGFADVLVGTGFDPEPARTGRVDLYLGGPDGPEPAAARTFEGDQAGDSFGQAAAGAGDVNGDGLSDLLVGAPRLSVATSAEGRATLFFGRTDVPELEPSWSDESDQDQAEYGSAVATAGDVNGDGFSEILVGARLFEFGSTNEGRAYLYPGTPQGPEAEPLVADIDQSNAEFGTSLAGAGDVNGDGYEDVIVGAPFYDGGEFNEGRAFVYLGSPEGPSEFPSWFAQVDQSEAHFGISVASAGDVNGDGFADVVIAADSYDTEEHTNAGAAFVYLGSPTGLATTPVWDVGGGQDFAFLSSAASAGDVDRDGFSDVIVGVSAFDDTLTNDGRALVYHGSPSGPQSAATWFAAGSGVDERFGFTVAGVGDVNGDGFSDVVVGAPLASNPETREGSATVYLGGPGGLSDTPAWTTEGNAAEARAGLAVATAGDVNGDGFTEVIVGAPGFDDGRGTAWLFAGSALGPSLTPSWTGEIAQAGAAYGRAVSTAGDVNGDGFADVIVGARSFGNDEFEEGAAFVYLGNGGPGISLRPQQRRADDAAPIAPLGATEELERFRLTLEGRTPFGRGRVRLEWEVKPLVVAFDGTDSEIGPWMDSGTTGAAISELVEDLSRSTPYHWRLRLHYDPTTTPFQSRGRWVTVPLNGQEETDLRTATVPPASGAVPNGGAVPGEPLRVGRLPDGSFRLTWGESCVFSDVDYEVYEGTLGAFTSHAIRTCSTEGATEWTFPDEGGSVYWLVVPRNSAREGSYGVDGRLDERPRARVSCLPQLQGSCP